MTSTFFIAGISFCAGNFLYQAVTDQQWGVALDRSFFQAGALLWVWVVMAFRGHA